MMKMMNILLEHFYDTPEYKQMISDAEEIIKVLCAGKIMMDTEMKDGTTQEVPFYYIIDNGTNYWVMSKFYSKKSEHNSEDNFIPLYRPLIDPVVFCKNKNIVESDALLTKLENKIIEIFEDFGITLEFHGSTVPTPLRFENNFIQFSTLYNIHHPNNKFIEDNLE